MPRQPLPAERLIKRAAEHRPEDQGEQWTFGPDALAKRPQHAALIGQCLAGWSYVDAEMAVVLGALLSANSKAAIAVYNTLRRSSGRREAIEAAAKAVLNADELELVEAILKVCKTVEDERNDLSHGCFIAFDKMPDSIVWIESAKMSPLLVEFHHSDAHKRSFGVLYALKEFMEQLLGNSFHYRITDLETILS